MIRRIGFAAGAAGLALAPLASEARLIVVPGCGGEAPHLLAVPADPAAPPRKENCTTPCHAATDRRGRAANGGAGCGCFDFDQCVLDGHGIS